MKPLRHPAAHALRLMSSPRGSVRARSFRVRWRAPGDVRAHRRAGSFVHPALQGPGRFLTGGDGTSQVPWRPLLRLCPALRPRPNLRVWPYRRDRCCPRIQHGEGFGVCMISRLPQGFSARCLRFTSAVAVAHAETRFRLAGSAFAVRASNPLGRDERFQVTSILLSRAFPDASWSHVRRRFYDRVVAEASPIAHETLQRIAQLYAIEKDIRGRVPDEHCAVRQERSRPIVAESNPGCAQSWRSSARRASSPRLSAMRSPAGRDFAVSSTTVGSRSIPIRLSVQSGRLLSIVKWSVRGFRWRRRQLGRHRHTDRKLQTQRRRTPRLSCRRADQDRQWTSQQRHRRVASVGLRNRRTTQSCGLKTPLTLHQHGAHTRAGASRRTAARSHSTRTLEDDDLRRRIAPDGDGRADGSRRTDQRPLIPGLC